VIAPLTILIPSNPPTPNPLQFPNPFTPVNEVFSPAPKPTQTPVPNPAPAQTPGPVSAPEPASSGSQDGSSQSSAQTSGNDNQSPEVTIDANDTNTASDQVASSSDATSETNSIGNVVAAGGEHAQGFVALSVVFLQQTLARLSNLFAVVKTPVVLKNTDLLPDISSV
jgi:hypothetical protein